MKKAEFEEIAKLSTKLQTAFYLACGRCNHKTFRFANHVGTVAGVLVDEGWKLTSMKNNSVLCPRCACEEKKT